MAPVFQDRKANVAAQPAVEPAPTADRSALHTAMGVESSRDNHRPDAALTSLAAQTAPSATTRQAGAAEAAAEDLHQALNSKPGFLKAIFAFVPAFPNTDMKAIEGIFAEKRRSEENALAEEGKFLGPEGQEARWPTDVLGAYARKYLGEGKTVRDAAIEIGSKMKGMERLDAVYNIFGSNIWNDLNQIWRTGNLPESGPLSDDHIYAATRNEDINSISDIRSEARFERIKLAHALVHGR